MKYSNEVWNETTLKQLEAKANADINNCKSKGWQTCTLDDIRGWWATNKNTKKTCGCSTYHIKHTIEKDFGKYCANNWLKYVLVESGFKPYLGKLYGVAGGCWYAEAPSPCNVMDNSVNYHIPPRAKQP